MNTSLPRVAPASPVIAVHAPPPGPPARPTAPDQTPERGAPARPFADMLRQRRADASPAAATPASPSAQDEAAVTALTAVPTEAVPEAEVPPATADTSAARTAKGRASTSSRLAVRPDKIAAEPTPSESPAATEAAAEPTTDRGPSPADVARPMTLPDDPVAIALPQGHDGGRTTAAAIADHGQPSEFGGVAVSPGAAARTSPGRTAEDARPASREPSAEPEGSKAAKVQPGVPASERTANADAGAHSPPSKVEPLPAPLAPLAPSAPPALAAAPAFAPLATSGPAPADPALPTPALPTPIDSPQFAGALGVHVSVLAKGGVQHAELHLNPAEMGPVSIRIELDGNAAQVQFGADLAETRQAIERGLPELASALRDAGFTLSGGGVSQHGSHRGAAGGGEPGATSPMPRAAFLHGETDVGTGTDAARTVRHVAPGGVDLYA